MLDRFMWEHLPLIARRMGEKELFVRIAPERSFAQWHLALHKSKPFVQAQLDNLLARQTHFGIKAGFKERPREAEIVLQLPLAHADEFLNAHNIFLYACMPFLRVQAGHFAIDFSKASTFHVQVEGDAQALEQFTSFVRNPKLLATTPVRKKRSRTKKQTKRRRGIH